MAGPCWSEEGVQISVADIDRALGSEIMLVELSVNLPPPLACWSP